MLTTLTPGTRIRQWVFLFLLIAPLFVTLFLVGVLFGRFPDWRFHLLLSGSVLLVISSVVFVGLNWRIGLYLVMFFVLWDRVLGLGQTGSLNATKLAIAMTVLYLLAAILAGQVPGWAKRLLDPLALVGAMFVIVSLMSLPFMPYPEIAIDLLLRRFNVVLLSILMIVAIQDRAQFHRAILWLVVGGALVGLATTSEAFTGVGLLERLGKSDPNIGSGRNTLQVYRGTIRLIGPSGDPNFYSIAQALPAVIAFGLFFYYRETWKKILLAFAQGVFIFNILGTGSRSGALAYLVGVFAVFFMCPVKNRVTKAAIASGLVFLGVAGLLAMDTGIAFERITSPGEASEPIEHRVSLWQMSLDMFYDKPAVGAGTNAFAVNYQNYRVPGSQDRALRPHNTYMQLLCENGIQGVVVYLMFYVTAFLSAICTALGTRNVRLKFETMALAALMLGFFVFAGTSNVLENELFFLVFGLCAASYNIYRAECEATREHYRPRFAPWTKRRIPPRNPLQTPALARQSTSPME